MKEPEEEVVVEEEVEEKQDAEVSHTYVYILCHRCVDVMGKTVNLAHL